MPEVSSQGKDRLKADRGGVQSRSSLCRCSLVRNNPPLTTHLTRSLLVCGESIPSISITINTETRTEHFTFEPTDTIQTFLNKLRTSSITADLSRLASSVASGTLPFSMLCPNDISCVLQVDSLLQRQILRRLSPTHAFWMARRSTSASGRVRQRTNG